MMTWYYHWRVETNYTLHLFFIFSVLCSHYVADFMKKLELCLMVISILLLIKFVPTQISVPKIGIRMSKTACINPWYYVIQKCFFANMMLIKKCSVISVFILLRLFFFKWNNPKICLGKLFTNLSVTWKCFLHNIGI